MVQKVRLNIEKPRWHRENCVPSTPQSLLEILSRTPALITAVSLSTLLTSAENNVNSTSAVLLVLKFRERTKLMGVI